MRTIRVGRYGIPYWPGRNVAGTFPEHREGTPVTTVPGPLRASGGWTAVRPASSTIIGGESQSPGRSFMGRTADDLETGTPPDRIDRGTTARNAGKIGNQVSGWPYDGNAVLVPHTRIPRNPITVTAFARTIDTGVTVPSIAIGNPVVTA